MDDRALIYRGADQPDLSVINPESDVWQHVKVRYSLALFDTVLISTFIRYRSDIWLLIGLYDIHP